jgi:predicted CopG family antitoxin
MGIKMNKEKTSIQISKETWKELADIKYRMGFKSYNEVIVYLLKRVKK